MNNYQSRGFTSALPCLSLEETSYYHKMITTWDTKLNFMQSDYRCKSNVLFKWVNELSQHPSLLKYVTEILGPNFDCWDTMFWFKRPGDTTGISRHQDAIYSNWKSHNTVNAWLALTPVSKSKTAPVVFYPGSHKTLLPHDDIRTNGNLLMRNQTVRSSLTSDLVELEMDPGTVTFIHPNVIHGGPGLTPPADKEERIGIEIYYVANTAKPILTYGLETSIRLKGKANPNIYYDAPPLEDFGETEQLIWRRAYDNQHANYYKMTNEVSGAM